MSEQNFELEPEEDETPAFIQHKLKPVTNSLKPKSAKKKKSTVKKTFIKIVISIILVLTGLSYGTYKVQQFFESKRIVWQSPIIIRTPVYVENRIATEKPQVQPVHQAEAANITEVKGVTTDTPNITNVSEPRIEQPSIANIVYSIYRLESSAGKNDSCRKKGLYNGYGFAPGTCYKTEAEVRSLVTKWVTNRIDDMPLNQLLCTYNLGPNSEYLKACMNQSSSYPYYKNYLEL